jgi:Phosphotransferase enzyme family
MAAAERALAAVRAAARAQGLPTESPVIVRDLTNVLVHLAPAPVVARAPVTLARLRGKEWFEEEMRLARFLAERNAPIAPPADEVDSGPHERDGFQITFWRWIDHDPERLDARAAGHALSELHATLGDYRGELPTCDRLDEVRGVLATLDRSAEIEELSAFAERLDALDGRPLHGDAHLGNVLWSPAGPLWNDLENACRGPIEYDLACLRFRGLPAADEAIAAYGTHDPARIDEVMPHLTLALAAWTQLVVERSDVPSHHEEARRRIARALRYAREM